MSAPVPRASIEHAAGVLASGGLVAFPTETVYGLGADASNQDAVERIFAVKGRPSGHPLIVHLATADQLDRYAAQIPAGARELAEACWPGPLTMLLPRSARVADAVTGGAATVGLRVPDHPVALELLRAFGGGVAAPSANRFGHVSPTTAAHVVADLGHDVDVVLDGGPCRVGIESTIVDLSVEPPQIIRPGGVALEVVEEVLGRPVGQWRREREVAAPGTLESHYAPSALVEVLEADRVGARARELTDAGRSVAAFGPRLVADPPPELVELEPLGPAEDYARLLYDRLRQVDRLGVEVVLVVPPDEQDRLGLAIRDRLARAAGPRTSD